MDFPVDFYADRISKLRRFIVDKNGNEITNTELMRFIQDGINPFYTFSDLVYQYVYSLLGYGNVINYLNVPSTYKDITPNNISRWDVLNPDLTSIEEYTNISTLFISNKQDAIKKVVYSDGSFIEKELDKRGIFIDNYSLRKQANSTILSKSPLFSRNKSIDILLAVYSARYNVYANNGAAGYLAKKSLQANNGGLESMFDNVNNRQAILDDINSRNGITGRKNLWGVSGVPIEFVKTLATISELMPLEETLANSIKIASNFQIPPVLVPRKDQSTFSNQQTAEVTVWENGLLNMANTVCGNLTKMFGMTNTRVMFDTSQVSALQANEIEGETLAAAKLANLEKIKTLSPETDISQAVNEIFISYGN